MEGPIAGDLNYLDAQAEATDGLPPDRHCPLLKKSQDSSSQSNAHKETATQSQIKTKLNRVILRLNPHPSE